LIYASATNTLSKLAIGTTEGHVLTVVSGVPAWAAPTGSGGGIASLGGLTVGTQVFANDTNVTISSAGSTHTLGWTGTLAQSRGGTGFGTYTTGDLLYASATNTLSKLAATTNGYVLTLVAGVPAWAVAGSGLTSLNGLTAATQTFANDTNITISSATSTHTLGWSGTLAVSRGGLGVGTITGLLVGNGTSAVTAVTGTASQILRRNAGNTAYEFFTIAGSDITGAALTKADDTNVTLTLGGSPTTALLRAASITAGWTGTLAVSRGGTGVGTLTGIILGTGTASLAGITGTAGQLLRRNLGDTTYEFFTPTYLTANQTITLTGDVTGSGATTIPTTIANNVVTLAKMATVATDTYLGRTTALTGNVESIAMAALTKADDTNVTLTLGGSPSTALLKAVSLTLGWTGTLADGRIASAANWNTAYTNRITSLTTTGSSGAATLISNVLNIPNYTLAGLGGFANPMTTLGDIIYGGSAPAGTPTRLAGNTTTTKQYLSQTGNGTVSAIPAWSAIAGADVTGAALTKVDDTNVTLTLGGTPTTALLRAASITVGWTGTLLVSRGGTGASTLTGIVVGNGASAMTAIAGTASQLLRRNALDTAYEFFTPTYLTANQTITLSGDVTGSGATAISTTIANNVVTLAKMAQVSTDTYLGRTTALTGNVESIAMAALTKTDDTNVTLTLGGTPATSLLKAVSLTLGWTGTLAVARGGLGVGTVTGILIGNGTSAVSAVAGTASQLLRRNAGNTAYEFFTATYMDNPMTTLGDIIYTNATPAPTRLAGNITTTKQYLSQTGTGTVSAAPAWATIAGADITGAALTSVNDTNVTITLGGTPATALLRAASITLGWTGTLADGRIASATNWNTAYTNRITSLTTTGSSGAATLVSNVLNIPNYTLAGLGGFANPMTTLGDVMYGGTTPAGTPTRLAGNITTAKQYLSQTGTGTVSAAPAWATITGADVTGAALTKVDDTNVTLTLGGTPSTALLRAASITAGWTGTLAVSRGGTGSGAGFTGILIGNGTSAFSAVAGTGSQVLRRNAGNTAYEFFTLSGTDVPLFSTTTTTQGTVPGSNNVGATFYLNANGGWTVPPGGISGSGTVNYITKWSGSSSLGNSILRENGNNIGIGIDPSYPLTINTGFTTYNAINRVVYGIISGAVTGSILNGFGGSYHMAISSSTGVFSHSGRMDVAWTTLNSVSRTRLWSSVSDVVNASIDLYSDNKIEFYTNGSIRASIQNTGDFRAYGDVIAYYSSDKRLKKNIKPIENAVQSVMKLGGYSFDWDEVNQATYHGKDYGVIAQEVEALFPEMVTKRDTGYLAVKYERLIPVLIQAVKEQQKEIEKLRSLL
jgi:hypothetical protein